MSENKEKNKQSAKENPYSSTVILPKTEFPMKADLAKREPIQIAKWQKDKTFAKMKEKRNRKTPFILHDGPPYANGNFHLGHSLNKVLKDIIIKSKHLQGFYVDMIPGWDCHGLPIEVQVLKNLGKKARDTGATELRQNCREYASSFVQKQGDDLNRFLCFWEEDHKYLTMDKEYEAKIVEVFGELFAKGYIYKGKKPVYWDITLATSHAEAEIEYHPHTSPSIYVKFPVVGKENLSCLIWTTTPWTLPANLAICFNEKFVYSIYATNDHGDLILADGLVEDVQNKTGIVLTKKQTITANDIAKIKFQHPFIDRKSISLFGDHVTLEAGTGCVHTAPGHGADDYKVGLAFGLEPFSPVDNYGKYTEEFPLMQGKKVFDANPEIIELLKEKNALFFHSEIEHSYPHSWRSKKPLIFRATPQWFFSMDHNGLKSKTIAEIDKVKWMPEWGYNRIRGMVEGRPDWCLSRQRNWGVPIPAFTCENCGETHITDKSIAYFTNIVKEKGIEVWYTMSAKDLMPQNTKCSKCDGSEFKQDNDILDVWFDSGVSSFKVLDFDGSHPPADLYLEGSDQHRGWFQSSLWPSVALRGIAPYKSVLTHGYILDDKGHIMSKSMGNGIEPNEIINVYGADILRLWISSQDFRDDVKAGQENIKIISEQYRKLRNTFRYLLGNLNGHIASDNLPPEKLDKIDRYFLSKFSFLLKEINNHYNSYQFHQIYHKLVLFATVDLSRDYFEIIRDRMYCENKNSPKRLSSTTALYEILKGLCIYSAPILSFTAEEVWENAGYAESVFYEEFPDLSQYEDEALEKKFANVFLVKESVQKAIEEVRQNGKIGKSLEAAVYLKSKNENVLQSHFSNEELEMYFVVSRVEFSKPVNEILSTIENELYTIFITLPDTHGCPRCWRHTKEINKEGELCSRCQTAIQ